jgi:hypothetical protein
VASTPLAAAVLRALADIGRSDVPPAAAPEVIPRPPDPAAPPEPVADDTLYVGNAGLVLVGPFIPALFARLDLTREGAFVDDAVAGRAPHLLQFVVDGGEPAPEHELTLNKLVCGLDLWTPLTRDVVVSASERETIESLLRAMIERWSIIGATSVAGLRETFLRRDGALTLGPEAWRLLVEPRPFDMLLDQIPWGFRTLRLPWMAQVLHVDWR